MSSSETYGVELLAPAKNAEVGRAAIDAGADAVYIGGPAFGARKAAGNSIADIAGLVRYASFWNARVLVTLNTLLSDEELDEAVDIACECRRVGVYALIIQDMRLAERLFAMGGFRLHASTQCDNRTAEHVRQLEEAGFSRVVLARELSYQQMADIRRQTSCELEAFVHGALCVSYSGRCYLSEAVCGRSANRGECAQMCRLPYDVLDADGHVLQRDSHILSLYDLDRSASLRELLDTGVTTLKIEGRLKDADYVRNITAYYHQLLNSLGVARTSEGRVVLNFTPDPAKTFHRGATDYFSYSRPRNLVNQLTPKSTGELIGKTPLPQGLLPGVTLHNGDGLTFGGQGVYYQPGMRINAAAGTPIYRNLDTEFQRRLAASDAAVRQLPVSLFFRETADGISLTVSDADKNTGTASIALEKAIADNPERAEQTLRQQLTKLGGTPLTADSLTIQWDSPLFLRTAVINELRRQAAAAFVAARENAKSAVSSEAAKPQQSIKRGQLPSNAKYDPSVALMTCKYCILHELGCCKKKHSATRGSMPAYIRQKNILLRIVTDCTRCEMQLYKA